MVKVSHCFIGLGSNLAQPDAQLVKAIEHLEQIPETKVIKTSGFWRSKPLGPQDQPDFINAVAELHTSLEPYALLRCCQEIERLHQRVKERHWGPRTLDLDILIFGSTLLNTPELMIPHPGLTQRNFVLLPLQQVAPDILINDHNLDYWLQKTGITGITQV